MGVSCCAAVVEIGEIEVVYRRFAGFVRRALARAGVRAGDVDDLTQEVFVTLHRKGGRFENDRAARAWLWNTARRVASNDRRARRRADARAPAWSPGPIADPEEQVRRREAERVLDRFADALPADARAVFVLSEVDGLPAPQIASRLGLNLNTTYSHIRRVRSRFARAVIAAVALLLVLAALLAGTCESRAPGAELRVAALSGPAAAAR